MGQIKDGAMHFWSLHFSRHGNWYFHFFESTVRETKLNWLKCLTNAKMSNENDS